MNPDKDFRFINYGDYGMDLYSNAIVVSQAFAKEHGDAVKGFVRAVNKATKDMIADPAGSVETVMKREPLLNKQVEIERTVATLKMEMNHPEIAMTIERNVFSTRDRLAEALADEGDNLIAFTDAE